MQIPHHRSDDLQHVVDMPDYDSPIQKRRFLAFFASLPDGLPQHFTVGQSAVLAVIGVDIRAQGYCDRTIAELAERASCSHSTVRETLRGADEVGLVTVTQLQPHILCTTSAEWQAELRAAHEALRL